MSFAEKLSRDSFMSLWSGYCDKKIEIAALKDEVGKLEDILRQNGFRPCWIPTCNCGSWHFRLDKLPPIYPEGFDDWDDE